MKYTQVFILSLMQYVISTRKLVQTEVYSSVADLEQLIIIDNGIKLYLERQIEDIDYKLNLLRKFYMLQENHLKRATENISNFLANPINLFLILKNLTIDWDNLKNEIGVIQISENDIASTDMPGNIEIDFPNKEDLNGAANALARIQEVYDFDAKSLANGIINGNRYESTLSASDCYVLAEELISSENYEMSIEWLEESLNRFDDQTMSNNGLLNIYKHLSLAYGTIGNYDEALRVTKKLLELDPLDEIANENQNNLQSHLAKMKKTEEIEKRNYYDYNIYKKLCQHNLQPTPKLQSELHCKYLTNDLPFLLIAPFKIEEMYLDPYITAFHDILFDTEIEYLKWEGRKTMVRALVEDFNKETNESVSLVTSSRVSKSGYIEDGANKHIDNINQRLEDMTKLTIRSSEILQIANYGIGGQYDPHFDFADEDDLSFEQQLNLGNRIATVLFYISDVQDGGATVFPKINVSVRPQKGSAVFWWNLHATGDLDYRSLHGACPVVFGSKWVANKWIHEKYQEFRRPCPLHRISVKELY